MIFLVLIGLGFCLAMFPVFRCAVCHPVALPVNGVRDLVTYIRHKDYNLCGTGELVASSARARPSPLSTGSWELTANMMGNRSGADAGRRWSRSG